MATFLSIFELPLTESVCEWVNINLHLLTRSRNYRRAGEGAEEASGRDHAGHHHSDAGQKLQADAR